MDLAATHDSTAATPGSPQGLWPGRACCVGRSLAHAKPVPRPPPPDGLVASVTKHLV